MNLSIRIILSILAVYRLSRLISKEDGPGLMFARMRAYTDDKRHDEQLENNKLEELGILAKPMEFWRNVDEGLRCPYCLGVWFGLFFALLQSRLTLKERIIFAFGVCGGQAIIQQLEDKYL